ncbi:NADPH dehydrogenase NamA [Mesobacillus foraminis]|uniref:NADPH dehydrogenase NamA n=1 Tax=Mesobacillus foraminis TaxID=279826 RepID=UPI000EF45ACE|nr:NADPH dehydrogenase NamA [Mesobacillus foraminis]
MDTKLFSTYSIKDVTLKNRIVMSPMCMHSSDESGEVKNFHLTHYTARALGQAGLIFPETLVVDSDGLIGPGDLGIWDDYHVKGLKNLVDKIHEFGAKVGAQIGHAGRVTNKEGVTPIGPSSIPFSENTQIPKEMTLVDIKNMINKFKQAARRVRESGFDILEVHCAHGYLLNEFLSPLSNQRTDEYGGSMENRYRMIGEIIDAVKTEWTGPLFVRISSTDYKEGGNTPETYVEYAKKMKEQGVDLVDCSSGGIAPVKVNSYPNYQVPAAEKIRNEVDIATGAVGLIKAGRQAEEILQNKRADLVFIGREFLKNPFWPRAAAEELGADIDAPVQYTRYGSDWLKS